MRSWEALPDSPDGALRARAPLTTLCAEHAAASLRELGRHLCELPYGRGGDRADFATVLALGRGTCSTKHAFLASVAAENGLPLELLLGLYEMREANTPGVGEALAAAHLDCVPEAHCYVRWRGERIDVTRAGLEPEEPIRFLAEQVIEPHQIGSYKVEWHQRRLRHWCESHGPRNWRRVWAAREAAIAAITESPVNPRR